MEELQLISITQIRPNPYQPRVVFDEQDLQELADSIQEHGLIQPIIVRKSDIVGYELLAGERRLRASQLAGLSEIPAIIKDLSNTDLLYQSIIENLQRTDLNPIEEATSYDNLVQRGLTHEEIAQIMGKSRPYITNLLRLQQLSQPVKKAVEKGQVTQGHARLLLSCTEEEQIYWMKEVIEKGLSVRQLESKLATKKTSRKTGKKDIFIAKQEKELSQTLGVPTRIHQKKDGSGQITIPFSSTEEYQRIIHNLNHSE